MDKLPNELQEMVASHLGAKDLRSYRLVGRRYEAIANRRIDTVKFVSEDFAKPFTIRPDVAQYIKRLHIENVTSGESSCNNPEKVSKLIQALHSSGADINELRIRIGWDKDGTAAEKYLQVLAESAPLLSNVTLFSFDHLWGHQDRARARKNTRPNNDACIALNTFLASLQKLQEATIFSAFADHVDEQNLANLWSKMIDTHRKLCCPDIPWHPQIYRGSRPFRATVQYELDGMKILMIGGSIRWRFPPKAAGEEWSPIWEYSCEQLLDEDQYESNNEQSDSFDDEDDSYVHENDYDDEDDSYVHADDYDDNDEDDDLWDHIPHSLRCSLHYKDLL